VCTKFLVRSNQTSESVGIFRSLQDRHERVTEAIGALASRGEQVVAVVGKRLLGQAGVRPYVGLPQLVATQDENVHRAVVRRVQQIVLEERTAKDGDRRPRYADPIRRASCIPRTFLAEDGLTSGSA
jgi:hypothetical protein